MDNFIVIPEWLAWCLLAGLVTNTVAQLVYVYLTWRNERGRRRAWYPTATEL